MNSTAKLAVVLAATWLVLAGPAWVVGGAAAIVALTLAAWLCFVPHLLVLAVECVCPLQDRPLAGLLVSMTTRLVVVLAGAAVICWYRSDLRSVMFLAWLAPCYFVALAVETRLVMAKAGSSPRSEILQGSSVSGTTSGG